MEINGHFNGSSDHEIAVHIDELVATRDAMLLLSYLQPIHPIYQDKGAGRVNRLKGYILSQFEDIGLPEQALPIVLEELQSGHSAYVAGAAAKALRGHKDRSPHFASYLLRALENTRDNDDAFSFTQFEYENAGIQYTTAFDEVVKTLGWLGTLAAPSLEKLVLLKEWYSSFGTVSKATAIEQIIDQAEGHAPERNCCDDRLEELSHLQPFRSRKSIKEVKSLSLEDQDGNRIRFGDFFNGRLSVVAFFYTRCDNPNKCSMTVTKMAQLQKQLGSSGMAHAVNVVLITYDPVFDTPESLKNYSNNRGFSFSEYNRVFRVDEKDLPALKEYFGTAASYSGSLVTQHSLELFLLDKKGRIIKSQKYIEWDNVHLIKALKKQSWLPVPLLFLRAVPASLVSLGIAFFPKCPFCWAAYLSVFGISTGTAMRSYDPRIKLLLIFLLVVNLVVISRRAWLRRFFLPLYITIAGVLLLLPSFREDGGNELAVYGAILIFTGSLLNSVPKRYLLLTFYK